MSGFLQRLGMRLQPLFDPERRKLFGRFDEIRQTAKYDRKALSEQRDLLSRTREELREVRESLRVQRDGQAKLQVSVRALRSKVNRDGVMTAGLLKRTRRMSEQQFQEEVALSRLTRIGQSTRPILVGPWTGEVGFELIYWAPFVRWFVNRFGIDPARVTVISRGGTRSWYGDAAGHYIDVFDSVTPEVFAADTAERLKQKHLSLMDRDLLRDAARTRHLSHPAILHPQLMYALFHGFFSREEGVRHVFEHSQHVRISVPVKTLVPGLPDDYVAVKFYFRPSFPETPENVAFVRGVLDQIAVHHKIVLLNPGFKVDEHNDYGDRRYFDLASLGATITPQNNLEIQTAVVNGARAFVGTYGGFSYLAPLCGVPAIAFYADRGFYLHHRYMADLIFAQLNAPALVMLPTDAPVIQQRAVLDLLAASPRR